MTFASAERAYLSPPEDWSCERCEDSDTLDHDDCVEAAEDARDQYLIDRADERREAGEDW